LAYYTYDEALNFARTGKKSKNSVATGLSRSCRVLSEAIINKIKPGRKNCIVAIDGFTGVPWAKIISGIKKSLESSGLNVRAMNISSCCKSPEEIEDMTDPYLKNDKSFGIVYKGKLKDFFNGACLEGFKEEIKRYKAKHAKNSERDLTGVVIVYGCGAALPFLKKLYDIILYIDITLDQLLNLFDKGSALPLGYCRNDRGRLTPGFIARRFSYVDYRILNIHKKHALKNVDWYGIKGDKSRLTVISRDFYGVLMAAIARQPFRPQPFYIHRIWGGKYMIKIRNIPLAACAFSMEVYAPLQNIRISFDDIVIKIPFLNVLWSRPAEILGEDTIKKFGVYFPLTANYDDTFNGGSLAIQVHPQGKYMREKFNEKMRHDETYYVVRAWPGAKTYLGLKEETGLGQLLSASRKAEKQKIPYDQDAYINSFRSRAGDLFLIPGGTVHASGENQLVLELDFDGSKVGAEYTFHIYDFLRPDLEGRLRPIHLDHAFNVINPYKRAGWVKKHLKQEPVLLRKGKNWAEYILGERKEMLYQVHRLEFDKKIEDNTNGRFHIITLVEGERVIVSSKKYPDRNYVFNYTETVIIPACLGSYNIINLGKSSCKVTKSFLK